jgi:hypothetical protein
MEKETDESDVAGPDQTRRRHRMKRSIHDAVYMRPIPY